MILEFVQKFEAKRQEIENIFRERHVKNYKEIVKIVVDALADGEWGSIDPDRIHEIDDGDYQGTLLYIIASKTYQPSKYWCVKVGYGSCSGCDTLQAIHGYDDGKPDESQVSDYMTLALHIVQGLKEI